MSNKKSSNNPEWNKRCDERIKLCKDLYKIVKKYESKLSPEEVETARKISEGRLTLYDIHLNMSKELKDPKACKELIDSTDIKGYLNDQIALNKNAKLTGYDTLTGKNAFPLRDEDIRNPVKEFLERAIVDNTENAFASKKELKDLNKVIGVKNFYKKDIRPLRENRKNTNSNNTPLLPTQYEIFRNENKIRKQSQELNELKRETKKLQAQIQKQTRQPMNNMYNTANSPFFSLKYNDKAENPYLPRSFNALSPHIQQGNPSLFKTRQHINNHQNKHPFAPSQPSKLANEIYNQGTYQNNINGRGRLPRSSSLKRELFHQYGQQEHSTNYKLGNTPYPNIGNEQKGSNEHFRKKQIDGNAMRTTQDARNNQASTSTPNAINLNNNPNSNSTYSQIPAINNNNNNIKSDKQMMRNTPSSSPKIGKVKSLTP